MAKTKFIYIKKSYCGFEFKILKFKYRLTYKKLFNPPQFTHKQIYFRAKLFVQQNII